MVDILTLDDFSGAVGETFDVEADGETYSLELIAASALPPSAREGGSFRLEFRGPFEPILPQAIYDFRRAGGANEIFIVPIAREAEGTRYEAVFY